MTLTTRSSSNPSTICPTTTTIRPTTIMKAGRAAATSLLLARAKAGAGGVGRRRSESASSSASPPPPSTTVLTGTVPNPAARAFSEPRRFVVFSDLHLSPRTLPTCLSVLAAVRDAAAERRAGVVFLGDWWHVRGALPVEPLNAVLRELASWPSHGVQGGLILLPGNHDQVDPLGKTHALTPLAAALGPERAHCFDAPAVWRGAVWCPYRRDPSVVRAALREAAEAEEEQVAAAMLHADVKGARVNAAWQARAGLDADALFPPLSGEGGGGSNSSSSSSSSPIRRVYSGHYHLPHDVEGLFPSAAAVSAPAASGRRGRRSAASAATSSLSPESPLPPTVTYIGSPYQVSRAEEGQRKRLLVLDAERGWQVDEELPLDVGRRFWTVRGASGGPAATAEEEEERALHAAAAASPSLKQQHRQQLDEAPTYEELLSARVRPVKGGGSGMGGDGGVLLELPPSPSPPPTSSSKRPAPLKPRTLVLRPGDCLRVEVPPPPPSQQHQQGLPAADGQADATTSATTPTTNTTIAAERLRQALSSAGVDLELVCPPLLPSGRRPLPPRLEAAESRAAAELLDAFSDSRGFPETVRQAARAVLEEASGGAAAASARPPRVELTLESVSVEGYGPFRDAQEYPLSQRGMRALTGRNEDDAGATSNGAGKSSLLSAVLWAFKALGGGGGGGGGALLGAGTSAASSAGGSTAAASSSSAVESARRRTAAEVVADGCRHARVVVRGTLNGEAFELERVAVRPRTAGAAAAAAAINPAIAPAPKKKRGAAAAATTPTPTPATPNPKAGTRLTLSGENRTLEDARATDRLVASLFATPLMARSLLLGQEELLALLDANDGRMKAALGALVDLEGWSLAKTHASRRLQATRRESDALNGQLATMRRVCDDSRAALEQEESRAGEWERARRREVSALREAAAGRRRELLLEHAGPLRMAGSVLRSAASGVDKEVASLVAESRQIAALEEEEEEEEEGEQLVEGGGDRHARETAAAGAAREAARATAARARAEAEAQLRPQLEAALAAVASAERRAFLAPTSGGGGVEAAAAAAAAPWDEPSRVDARERGGSDYCHDDDGSDEDQVMAVLREEAARLAGELAAAERAHAALEGERASEKRRRDALAEGVGPALLLLPSSSSPRRSAVGRSSSSSRRCSSSPSSWPVSIGPFPSRQGAPAAAAAGGGGGGGGVAPTAARAAPLTTTATAIATAASSAANARPHHHHEHNFMRSAEDGRAAIFAPECDRCGQQVDPEAAAAALARLDAALAELCARCERAQADADELRQLAAANSAAIEREQSARRQAQFRLASEAAASLRSARERAAALERDFQALLQGERDAARRADEAWAAAVRAAGERERLRREGRELRRQRAQEMERRAAALRLEAAGWRAAAEQAEQAAEEAAAGGEEEDEQADGGVLAATQRQHPPPSSLAASVPARAAACRRAAALAADALAAADRRAADLSPHGAALEALRAQHAAHELAAEQAERSSAEARERVAVLKAVDAAFGRSGVPAFVLEGVLGELQRAAEGHLRALSDTMQLELSLSSSSAAAAAAARPAAAAAGKPRGRTRRARGQEQLGNDDGAATDDDDDGDENLSTTTIAATTSTTSTTDGAVVKTVLVPAADGSGLASRTVAQLSGGERKRAALALALAFAQVAAARGRFRCSLLMLDEALEKLDDEGEARVLGLLAGLLAPPPQRAGEEGGEGGGAPSAAAAAAPSSSSLSLAYETIILADQAAAFATHALPAVDYVVKSRGRARLELAAAGAGA
jgi:hypothetical protein